MIADHSSASEITAFISYSHDSEAHRQQLQWLIALLPVKGKYKGLRAAVVLLKSEMEKA